MGGTAPCALSHADEFLVRSSGRADAFTDISRVLCRLLEDYKPRPVDGLAVLRQEALRAERKAGELLQ